MRYNNNIDYEVLLKNITISTLFMKANTIIERMDCYKVLYLMMIWKRHLRSVRYMV